MLYKDQKGIINIMNIVHLHLEMFGYENRFYLHPYLTYDIVLSICLAVRYHAAGEADVRPFNLNEKKDK